MVSLRTTTANNFYSHSNYCHNFTPTRCPTFPSKNTEDIFFFKRGHGKMALRTGARVRLAAAGVVFMVSGVCRVEQLNMIESVGRMFHNGRLYMGILSSLRNHIIITTHHRLFIFFRINLFRFNSCRFQISRHY